MECGKHLQPSQRDPNGPTPQFQSAKFIQIIEVGYVLTHFPETRKFEARNPKFETISKLQFQNTKQTGNKSGSFVFAFRILVIRICFEFRYSNFEFRESIRFPIFACIEWPKNDTQFMRDDTQYYGPSPDPARNTAM